MFASDENNSYMVVYCFIVWKNRNTSMDFVQDTDICTTSEIVSLVLSTIYSYSDTSRIGLTREACRGFPSVTIISSDCVYRSTTFNQLYIDIYTYK